MRSLLLVAALLGACDGPIPGEDAGPARVELGEGATSFREVADGETLALVTGCQGSQHVAIGTRAWSVDPRGTIIDLSLTRDRDAMRVSQSFRLRISLQPVEGESYSEFVGFLLQVPIPDLALEEDLTLRAVVTDVGGVEVVDEHAVRIAWDPEGGCDG